jgi:hypothetical protein
MRYREAQQIADRQIRSRRHGQVNMLVVEFGYDQTVDGSRRVVAAFAKPPPYRGGETGATAAERAITAFEALKCPSETPK